jgi:hypothetical protein
VVRAGRGSSAVALPRESSPKRTAHGSRRAELRRSRVASAAETQGARLTPGALAQFDRLR